jgi:hypothetical protein
MKFRATLVILLTVSIAWAAQTNPESPSPRGKLPRTEAAALFERFSCLRLPANAADVSRAIGNSD